MNLSDVDLGTEEYADRSKWGVHFRLRPAHQTSPSSSPPFLSQQSQRLSLQEPSWSSFVENARASFTEKRIGRKFSKFVNGEHTIDQVE